MREEVRDNITRLSQAKTSLSTLPTHKQQELHEDLSFLQEEIARLKQTNPSEQELQQVERLAQHLITQLTKLQPSQTDVKQAKETKQLRVQLRVLESDVELIAQAIVRLQKSLSQQNIGQDIRSLQDKQQRNHELFEHTLAQIQEQLDSQQKQIQELQKQVNTQPSQEHSSNYQSLADRISQLEEQGPTKTHPVDSQRIKQLEQQVAQLQIGDPEELERLKEWLLYLLERQGYIER